MQIGVLVGYHGEEWIDEIKKVHDLGFKQCQLSAWEPSAWTDRLAAKLSAALEKYDVTVSTFWCGWGLPIAWNLESGPYVLGLVPPEFRDRRLKLLMEGADFAKKIGVQNVATHVGFIPENAGDPVNYSLVATLRTLADHLKKNDQYFMFETGQETPTTLLRTILDIGTDNLGINYDPANLIMYGKANPVDALLSIGKYIRDIHAKDGCYPTDPRKCGIEKPLGSGMVNYPVFIKRLKEIGYDGPITIEREIDGDQQIKDILFAKDYLTDLWNNTTV